MKSHEGSAYDNAFSLKSYAWSAYANACCAPRKRTFHTDHIYKVSPPDVHLPHASAYLSCCHTSCGKWDTPSLCQCASVHGCSFFHSSGRTCGSSNTGRVWALAFQIEVTYWVLLACTADLFQSFQHKAQTWQDVLVCKGKQDVIMTLSTNHKTRWWSLLCGATWNTGSTQHLPNWSSKVWTSSLKN